MTDPRIIPDDTLARYRTESEGISGYTGPLVISLLDHIEALIDDRNKNYVPRWVYEEDTR